MTPKTIVSKDGPYHSIAAASEGMYVEKGSKFIACAYPIQAESELKDLLDLTKKNHSKARHYCYAYLIGADKSIFRSNDDGEPSGTAGKPIFNQIRSKELSDVLVVVVRYFGGVLLGTSGLIHAYKTAAAIALENAIRIEKTPLQRISFSFLHEDLNAMMPLVKQKNISILEKEIAATCRMEISFPLQDEPQLRQQLASIASIKFL